MAGLKVFVSSTCVDLGAQRAQVRTLLERMGYEPVMSDHSDVLFDHRMHTHTSCIKEIANADIVILLIGSRFGGNATPEALSDLDMEEIAKSSNKTDLVLNKQNLSITQVEVIKAIESDVPLFAFVDSKVYSDHHLYQKNKDKSFANDITYPSIEKPETAKYIFEFITFITQRFSNNAITAYSSFSDIEDHLVKQWSLTFQRLLREERDKSIEGRRADAMIEQIQDLKAVVLQSIGAGSGRDLARSVLRFRRIADFLLSMRVFNANLDLSLFQGSFDELLAEFGIVETRPVVGTGPLGGRIILIRSDDTYLRVRVPDRRFQHFAVEWQGFSQLDTETKKAVLDGVEDSEMLLPPLFTHIQEQYQDDEAQPAHREAIELLEAEAPLFWTDSKISELQELWQEGKTATEIAERLGGVSRNAVIGKAHRLGLRSRPRPPSE
jgi:Domain of unknown function (DUF4062)/GcrA cell cycle regulator